MLGRIILALPALAVACGDDGSMVMSDAGPIDAPMIESDGAPGSDGATPLAWVDFAITGCPEGLDPHDAGPTDGGATSTPCRGPAPLELSFAAISPAPIEVYRWELGDGSQSALASPTHVYSEPGAYDVNLAVGGPGGTASKMKPGVVVVRGASLGSPCETDSQCGTDLACTCDQDAACDPVLPQGLCTAGCSDTVACAEGVCADLDPAVAGGTDWRIAACLVACDADGDCPAGLTCQDLRAGDGTGGWVRGCFAPGVLGAVGDSCVDGAGALDGARCASGQCLDLGARGLCGADCTSSTDCPDSAACATFVDAGVGPTCLDRCESAGECDADPWLACEAPGASADLGFTVDEAAAPDGYCAPSTCAMPADCGPDGACTNGYCGPM